jgi:hypothetical protein
MKHTQIVTEDSWEPEEFRLKDGIDPASVNWEKEIEFMTIVNDGLTRLQQKLDNIIEQRRKTQNAN